MVLLETNVIKLFKLIFMKLRVKVTEGWTDEDAKLVKKIQINKAKAFYRSCPFATKVHVASKIKLPLTFIQDNWQEIQSVL